MNRYRLAIATLVLGALTACNSAAPAATATPSAVPVATATPSASPTSTPDVISPQTLLARGTFKNKGATVELDATGRGSSVQGTMTMYDVDFSFTVDLECTRTTPGGLILIGGDVIDSTFDLAPIGSRVAIVLKRGSPVQAHPDFEVDPPAATCLLYLESLTDAQATPDLEPIVGTVELGP